MNVIIGAEAIRADWSLIVGGLDTWIERTNHHRYAPTVDTLHNLMLSLERLQCLSHLLDQEPFTVAIGVVQDVSIPLVSNMRGLMPPHGFELLSKFIAPFWTREEQRVLSGMNIPTFQFSGTARHYIHELDVGSSVYTRTQKLLDSGRLRIAESPRSRAQLIQDFDLTEVYALRRLEDTKRGNTSQPYLKVLLKDIHIREQGILVLLDKAQTTVQGAAIVTFCENEAHILDLCLTSNRHLAPVLAAPFLYWSQRGRRLHRLQGHSLERSSLPSRCELVPRFFVGA